MGLGDFTPCMILAATFGKHVTRSSYAFSTLDASNAFPGISLASHCRVNDRHVLMASIGLSLVFIQCADANSLTRRDSAKAR